MKDIIAELVFKIDSLKILAKKTAHTKEDRNKMLKIGDEIKMYLVMLSDERIANLSTVKNTLSSNYRNLEFDIHIEENNAQMRIDMVKGLVIKQHINQAIVTVTSDNQLLIQPGPEADHKIEETLIQAIESIFGRKPVIPQTQRIN